MELTYTRLDMAATTAQGHKDPGDVITRGHANELWLVPFRPLDFKTQPDWRQYKKDQHIYVPVFPYLTPSNPADALGFAFQLGVRALHDLGGKPVRRLHLVIGEPVNQIQDAQGSVAWQFYMGLGVVLQ